MRKIRKKIKNLAEKRRYRRKLSTRSKIIGDSERPRICAVRTNKNLSVQVIDDNLSKTILSLSTYGKNKLEGAGKSVDGAKVLGAALAGLMKERGIAQAVFDRNGLPYKGILAALADSIRDNGIKI